jgi:hypothetical protein
MMLCAIPAAGIAPVVIVESRNEGSTTMRVDRDDKTLTVVLSRRNLLVLLQKLDMGDAAHTLVREMDDGIMLRVLPEDDAQHYRDHEPGPMPEDETASHDAETALPPPTRRKR